MAAHSPTLSTKLYYPADNVYSQDHKKIIANKAAALIQNGMFVLTSGGTTIIEMATCPAPSLKGHVHVGKHTGYIWNTCSTRLLT